MTDHDLAAEIAATAPEQLDALRDRSVLVGLSGGPDSVTLLHVLLRLAPSLALGVHTAHLDHALREGSAEDTEHVRRLAARLGVPLTAMRVPVRELARERGLSVEAAAREARYAFLAEAARPISAVVAVAHNRDDQAETVLLSLARGAGLSGLTGMRPVSPVPGAPDVLLVRPVLGIDAAAIRAYCRHHDLPVLADPSNESLEYARNRVRHVVLPALTAVNSRAAEHIARTAERVRAEDDALEGLAGETLDGVAEVVDGAIVLDRAALGSLPEALMLRVLRRAVARVAGSLEGVERVHLLDLARLFSAGQGGREIHLPGGLRAREAGGRVALWRGDPPDAALYPLPLLCATDGPPWSLADGWRVSMTHGRCAAPDRPRTPGLHEHVRPLGEDYHLRPPRLHERFRPLGMAEEKGIMDFLADAKVPRSLRSRVPVLASGGVPVCVLGRRIDDRWRLRGADDGFTCVFVEIAPPA